MNKLITVLEPEKWLELNAKLQQKKNTVRKALHEKGVLPKDKVNDFDNYAYFSEAGYKQLFTELFSEHGLELSANEVERESYTGNNPKMPNGRFVTFEFILTDIDTGFYECTQISGEGLDKGDKALYKADTGALKYYLANTFMVATGDDAEKESPESKMQAVKMSDAQRKIIDEMPDTWKSRIVEKYGSLDISKNEASEIIGIYLKKKGAKNENH